MFTAEQLVTEDLYLFDNMFIRPPGCVVPLPREPSSTAFLLKSSTMQTSDQFRLALLGFLIPNLQDSAGPTVEREKHLEG